MKYFEHYTTDRNSVIAKLIRKKFGAEGYGIYMALLEVIGENVKPNNLKEWGNVDKMHDIDSLSDECGTTPEKLREFLKYCDERGIFEKKNGQLYCSMMKERLDPYSNKIRQNPTKSDKVSIKRREQKRTEENRIKKNDTPLGVSQKESAKPINPQPSVSDSLLKSKTSLAQIARARESLKHKLVLSSLALLIFVVFAGGSAEAKSFTYSQTLTGNGYKLAGESASTKRSGTTSAIKKPKKPQTKEVAVTSISEAQKITVAMAIKRFGHEHVDAFVKLVNSESHFRPDAVNPSSGACGMFQAMPCSKMQCELSDVECQANWGMNYIERRYKNPTQAWNFKQNISPSYDFNKDGVPDGNTWY